MSYNDFIVPAMRRREIRQIASAVRRDACPNGEAYVDIVDVLERIMPLRFGEGYEYRIEEDASLQGLEGLTLPDDGIVRISRSTYENAVREQEGRARLTIGHELGHFLMHKGLGVQLARPKRGEVPPRFMCSEWQADCFSGELLIDPGHLARCRSVREASHLFQVSIKAVCTQVKAYKGDGLLRRDFPEAV